MTFAETPLFLRLLAQSPLSRRELVVLVGTAPQRYKEHYIEKRNGRGLRLISQPTAELKFFQRLLVTNELQDLPIHESAVAYRAGKAIRDHAEPHARSRFLLKLDFKDFFPSLSASAVAMHLDRLCRYSPDEIWVACQLLCKGNRDKSSLHLSIGAPSSPILSNALLYDFDDALSRYCIQNSVVYTRYADDIALSTSVPNRLDETLIVVQMLLKQHQRLNLTLNSTKQVNVSKKRRRTLTGLTLSNDGRASIGRIKKRELRAALHNLTRHGTSEMPVSRLKGMLAFTHSVDQSWVVKLCRRYGYKSIDEIGAGSGAPASSGDAGTPDS